MAAAPIDPATLHDEKLGFGKHRDKSFAEAAAEADYVEWALSMDRPKGRLATFCSYIKQTVHAAPTVAAPSAEPVAAADSEDDQPLKARGVTARAVAKKRVRAANE